jgi:uncharacterized phage-associated protein
MEIRRRLVGVSVLKTHKLLYYCQGWHLAWHGEPMFRESIEAWSNGPVVGALWAAEKHGHAHPPEMPLSSDQLTTVDYVLARYGALSGRDLVNLTHGEGPWQSVSTSESSWSSDVIDLDALATWFRDDEQFKARVAAITRLRQRRDALSFDPVPESALVRAAVGRALSGTSVQHSRPV